MKIILDESVPQKLRLLIEGHSVVTVAFLGWSGLRNGALRSAAEEAGYELFITADQEIAYQQNLSDRNIALLVLRTNNWDRIRAAAGMIATAIDSATRGSYAEADIPE